MACKKSVLQCDRGQAPSFLVRSLYDRLQLPEDIPMLLIEMTNDSGRCE